MIYYVAKVQGFVPLERLVGSSITVLHQAFHTERLVLYAGLLPTKAPYGRKAQWIKYSKQ